MTDHTKAFLLLAHECASLYDVKIEFANDIRFDLHQIGEELLSMIERGLIEMYLADHTCPKNPIWAKVDFENCRKIVSRPQVWEPRESYCYEIGLTPVGRQTVLIG